MSGTKNIHELEMFGANFDGMIVDAIDVKPPERVELACPKRGSYYGWPRASYRRTDRRALSGRTIYQFEGYR